jgi:hypothetical protein
MSEYMPEFIGGPKDGAHVPIALWVLDTIEMVQHMPNKNMIYLYNLDQETKNYIYAGQYDDQGGVNE